MNHVFAGDCPDDNQPDARDMKCPACRAMNADSRSARHAVGKWLNEEPNRPVSREDVAALCASFDALATPQRAAEAEPVGLSDEQIYALVSVHERGEAGEFDECAEVVTVDGVLAVVRAAVATQARRDAEDAARYRWLREMVGVERTNRGLGPVSAYLYTRRPPSESCRAETDAAIDAAIASNAGEKP